MKYSGCTVYPGLAEFLILSAAGPYRDKNQYGLWRGYWLTVCVFFSSFLLGMKTNLQMKWDKERKENYVVLVKLAQPTGNVACAFLTVAGNSHSLSICKSTCTHNTSKAHFWTSGVADVHLMINDLVGANVFSIQKARCHPTFPWIKGNPLLKTNMVKMKKWLKCQRTKFSVEQAAYEDVDNAYQD